MGRHDHEERSIAGCYPSGLPADEGRMCLVVLYRCRRMRRVEESLEACVLVRRPATNDLHHGDGVALPEIRYFPQFITTMTMPRIAAAIHTEAAAQKQPGAASRLVSDSGAKAPLFQYILPETKPASSTIAKNEVSSSPTITETFMPRHDCWAEHPQVKRERASASLAPAPCRFSRSPPSDGGEAGARGGSRRSCRPGRSGSGGRSSGR